MNDNVTYKSAGVDIDAGMESLRRIKKRVKESHGIEVLAGLGAFGSLFDLTGLLKEYEEPVLVQSTDGVGTKLMVATMAGVFTTVGIDIVNHSCNDILCQGARPLTFLDYIAVAKLDPNQIEQIVTGMATACVATGTALVGGETAELPGVYVAGEFDLAGTITGVVEKKKIIDGSTIIDGDRILALHSKGLHTNGYTMARKVFFDKLGMTIDTTVPELGETIGEALLEPHRDYSKIIWPLLQNHAVKGIAHITGGGLIDNVPRIIPNGVDACFEKAAWEIPPLFTMIQQTANATETEMFRSFNMGVGMILVVAKEEVDNLKHALSDAGEDVIDIGFIKAGSGITQLL